MTDHHKAVADAARAVEEAWNRGRPFDIMDEVRGVRRLTEEDACAMLTSVGDWLAARRAARDAGMTECMLSRETLAKVRAFDALHSDSGTLTHELREPALEISILLVRDLAGLLDPKEPG